MLLISFDFVPRSTLVILSYGKFHEQDTTGSSCGTKYLRDLDFETLMPSISWNYAVQQLLVMGG